MSQSNYEQELVKSYKQVSERLGRKREQFVFMRPPMKFSVEVKRPDIKKIKDPAYRTKHQKIVDDILAAKNLEWNEVFNDKRYRLPSLVRNEVWWTLKQCGLTYNQIGRLCRPAMPYDHTTILHGVKRHQRIVDEKNDAATGPANTSHNAGWEGDGDWVD